MDRAWRSLYRVPFWHEFTSVALNFGWVTRAERINTLFIFNRSHCNELFGFGIWVTVTNVIGPLLTSIDQFFVGSILGAVAVAHYTIPMNLAGRSQILSLSLATALFPRFSQLTLQQAMPLAEKAVLSLGYSFGVICSLTILSGNLFLTLWLGASFAFHAAPVFELLMIGAWFNGIAYIPYTLLQGQGRPDLVAKLHALELLPFILVLWLLLHRFGLPGAALAWTCRVAVDAIFLFKFSRISVHQLLRLIPALVLILISYLWVLLGHFPLIWSLLFDGSIVLAFAACAMVFDPMTKQTALAVSARLIKAVS